MSNLTKSQKKSSRLKNTGRFNTAEEVAKAKNYDLVKLIKQAGLKVKAKQTD